MSVCVCVCLCDRFIMFVICAGLVERMLGPFFNSMLLYLFFLKATKVVENSR